MKTPSCALHTITSGTRTAVMGSCAQAITAMVDCDRSAIRFPTDLANNLRLIAKEMGMRLDEWVRADVLAKMDHRSCE